MASIVFHPWGSPTVESAPLGDVSAYAQTGGAFLIQLALGWTGHPDAVARKTVQSELQKAFEGRLSTDITATIDVRTGQFDFIFQPLGPGEVPFRPMRGAMSEGERFVANELQELRPGVPQVIGPLDPAAGALIDFDVRGPPVRYRCECKPVIDAAFAPVLTGNAPTIAPTPLGTNWGVVSGQATRAVSMPCRWYLVTEVDAPTPQADTTQAAVRIRGRTWIGFPIQ